VQNLLFICSRNQWRSPTAEKIYAKDQRCNSRSAGTSPRAKRTVNSKDIIWADMIFVMEYKHKDRLKAEYSKLLKYKKVIVLDIPDDYGYMDEALIEILKESIEPYFEEEL